LADNPEPADRVQILANAALAPAFRGEDVGATLVEIEQLLGASTDITLASGLHDASGAAAMGAGRLAECLAQYRESASMNTAISATDARSLAGHAAVWNGDIPGAAAELAAIDASGFHAPTVEVRRLTIRAALAVASGDRAEALGLYRDALRRWRDLRLVFDEALCVIDMATLLDPAEPEVRAAAIGAREILVRLGAKPFIARLDAALDRTQETRRPADAQTEKASATPA
jgi:hypothetical protein